MEGDSPICGPTRARPLAWDDFGRLAWKSCIFEYPLDGDNVGLNLDCLADDPVECSSYLRDRVKKKSDQSHYGRRDFRE